HHENELLTSELQTTNVQLKALTGILQDELVLAREIQKNLLPDPSPNWPGLDMVCYSQAAQEVGGDFYSYRRLDNDHYLVAVGDVSGKGVSAALLMAMSLSKFDEHFSDIRPLPERFALLDTALTPYKQPHRQNCALCCIEIGEVTQDSSIPVSMINAGCIPPYIKRVNGQVEHPEIGGFALGQGFGVTLGYQPHEMQLMPGDLLILTSDGVVEANNQAGDMLGFDQLMKILVDGPTDDAAAMLKYLQLKILEFTEQADQHDDMTIVVIRV
ncbi:MAG: SpoIIE family protein phosphatase, partial [Chloroflexota bacterium]